MIDDADWTQKNKKNTEAKNRKKNMAHIHRLTKAALQPIPTQ